MVLWVKIHGKEVINLNRQRSNALRYSLLTLLTLVLVVLSGCMYNAQQKTAALAENGSAITDSAAKRPEVISSADEAKKLLIDGNIRYVKNQPVNKDLGNSRRNELANKGQHPFAVIVSCSDSRVPPEIIFDQALGDLFVVRTAGNVVDPIAIGSVEYAVEHLKAPLIVVMGHMKCGAVKATVEGGEAPGSIGSIVEKVKRSLDKVKAAGVEGEELVEETANENVEATIADLEKSPIIKHLVESGKLKIVGAKYHLGTGQVEWFQAK